MRRVRFAGNDKQAGFLLAELAAGAAVLLLCAGLAAVPAGCYLDLWHRAQVRAAAGSLAADIRAMQQQAYFSTRASCYITASADKRGYIWHSGGKSSKKRFDAWGCGGVYFAVSGLARYNTAGSPAGTASFELQHERLAGFKCRVYLEPVTGRVVQDESG